jgi:hypothetical protein
MGAVIVTVLPLKEAVKLVEPLLLLMLVTMLLAKVDALLVVPVATPPNKSVPDTVSDCTPTFLIGERLATVSRSSRRATGGLPRIL